MFCVRVCMYVYNICLWEALDLVIFCLGKQPSVWPCFRLFSAEKRKE
jgi:hypothetical protein